MTIVNVTTVSNQVLVTAADVTTVVEAPSTSVVVATTSGPQGPPGPPGNFMLDDAAKIDRSVIYYDAASSTFKADAVWTTNTIVDGANF